MLGAILGLLWVIVKECLTENRGIKAQLDANSAGLVVQSSTRTIYQHARHGLMPQIDRAAIRRTYYPWG